jgi:hypothetical protein
MDYSERITIQMDYSTRLDAIIDYVIRRPAIPLWWDPVSRPHVAVLMPDPLTGEEVRYFLSRCGSKKSNGRISLEVANIDNLPKDTILEVRFNATKSNLYQLEMVGTVPCWRWLGRRQGLPDFNSEEAIYWDYILDTGCYIPRDMIFA